MAEAFAKFRVGTPGLGASHASYITRSSALEPHKERNRDNELERNNGENSVASAPHDNLSDRALAGQSDQDADPVWTWNAPMFLTGDDNDRESASAGAPVNVIGREHSLTEKMLAPITSPNARRRLKEKVANVRTYFGSKEQFEKAKGGRTHYRVILSFDVPATNSQIRQLTNLFLKETFPKAIAFGAIHRDTEHPHVHLYLHARQTDGKKIYLYTPGVRLDRREVGEDIFGVRGRAECLRRAPAQERRDQTVEDRRRRGLPEGPTDPAQARERQRP